MTPQFFTLAMCQKLSSLAPGFEGHYGYYKFYDGTIEIACDDEIWWGKKWLRVQQSERKVPEFICFVWQAEDVLMHLDLITDRAMTVGQVTPFDWRLVGRTTANFLIEIPDTAYQKIEEYLWTILK